MKRIKYLMFSLLLLLPVISLNAKTINKDDVPNRTYVIGSHMYTREINTNTGYDGKLTTQLIMLAAKTIDSYSIDDMIIFYKNPKGKWVNAMTGEEIVVPDTFMINYQDKAPQISYGDINDDNAINTKDLLALNKYLNGMRDLTPQGLANADINADGKVNKIDLDLFGRAISRELKGDYDLTKGPIKIKTVSATFKLSDTVVHDRLYAIVTDVEGRVLNVTDPEKEGYVFDGWYIEGTDTKVEQPYFSNEKDMVYEARFSQPPYMIEVSLVDSYSPDRVLSVKKGNEDIPFKEIRYLHGLKLCDSINPTVSLTDLYDIVSLEVMLTDDSVVEAFIDSDSMMLNPQISIYGSDKADVLDFSFNTWEFPKGTITIDFLVNGQIVNSNEYYKSSKNHSISMLSTTNHGLNTYYPDSQGFSDLINISYYIDDLESNNNYQFHVNFTNENGISKDYYSNVINSSKKNIYTDGQMKATFDYLNRNNTMPLLYKFTINNKNYYMAYKMHNHTNTDDYEIFDEEGNRDETLYSIPSVITYFVPATYGDDINNTVLDSDYQKLFVGFDGIVNIEFHDDYLLALSVDYETNTYSITKYTINDGKVVMLSTESGSRDSITLWK